MFKLIERENGILEIDFNKLKYNTIVIKGHSNIVFESDLFLGAKGEMQLASKNANIHIDSINADLHLNCRNGKTLNDLPESIEYRQNLENERQLRKKELEEHSNQPCIHEEIQFLKDKIEELETKVKILENQNGFVRIKY